MMRYFNPLVWLRWMGQFVTVWVLTIPWRETPKALPALVLTLAIVVAAAISLADGNAWRSRWIAKQYADAIEVDDFTTAELLLRRRLKVDPQDWRLHFEFARIRYQQDHHDEAVEIMGNLVSQARYGDAARWLLKEHYLGKDWQRLSDKEQAQFGDLLELLHSESGDDQTIQGLLARYYVQSNQPAQAVKILVKLSTRFPVMGLQAAAIQRSLGDETSARRLAERILERLSKRLREEPTNAALALTVAQNQLFLKQHREAVQTLEDTLGRVRNEQESIRLRQALAAAVASHASHLQQAGDIDDEQRVQILKMLERALALDARNPLVLALVVDQVLSISDEDDARVRALQKSLVGGVSPGISHFIKGTSALMKDNHDVALVHLETAAEILPNSGAILNNLAVAMLSRDESNLEEILRLSERAIEQTNRPTPHFFETRGQIHFRLGNYLKAVPDFERALAVPSLATTSHEMLAKCYLELGQPDLSRKHAEAASSAAKDQSENASS